MHPNDPLYSQQLALTKIGDIEKVWDEYSGVGIHVGIYDIGVQAAHPDLAANIDTSRAVIINGNPVSGEPNAATPDPHGTVVAGILGAAANNNTGFVGVAWGAKLTSVPIVDPDSPVYINNPDFTNLLSAIHQMVSFDITNNSWNALADYSPGAGLIDPISQFRQINLEYEHAAENGRNGLGTVVVQGVGNDNLEAAGSGVNASRYTISVAGTREDGFAADFSNHGACVLVTAPSTEMVSTDLTGAAGLAADDYFDASDNAALPSPGLHGTSLSTPEVSGVAALMLQANPGLGWRDVQNILAASATHTGSAIGAAALGTNEDSFWLLNDAANWNGGGMHFSNDYGYGMLNAYNAVRMAEVWSLFGSAQTSANEQVWNNSDDTDRVIPDNGTLTTSVLLTPSPAISVEHVELTVELTHTDFTQLRIFLVSPSGTESQLYDGSGGTNATSDSLLTWTFATDALRGENASGTWTVRIEDKAAGETGTLSKFTVVVYGEQAATDPALQNDTYHYTDEFLAMAGLTGQGGRTVLSDAGGTDWIDAAAVTGNFALNLGAGATSSVNGAAWFSIAGGTTIENAVTGDGNDSLTGNGGANTLYGMRGNDTLDGGTGADQMHGGKGNDAYTVDNSGDVADETGSNGTDLVKSSVSFSLADTIHARGVIENLTLLAGAVSATGNDFGNILMGNSGANVLDGRGGIDRLIGGAGSDTYRVDTTTDIITEAAGSAAGTADAIIFTGLAGRTLTMSANVERLTLAGAAATNGTGNPLANTITGNAAANVLKGGLGNDTLTGNSGADKLYGGAGRDTLTGGAGKDLFFFDTALNKVSNVDRIVGFSHVDDTIRLENAVFKGLHTGTLKAAAFWVGKSAHDADDRIVYDKPSGALYFDSDGSGHHAAIQFATLTNKPVLNAGDFTVI